MEIREYMKEVRRARLRVEALMERRSRCAEMAYGRTPRTSKALEQLQRELDSRIQTLAVRTMEAERHIDALENEGQRDVLRYRYLNGWDWRSIAQRMHYSQDWVKHMHTRALEALGAGMEKMKTRKDTFGGV